MNIASIPVCIVPLMALAFGWGLGAFGAKFIFWLLGSLIGRQGGSGFMVAPGINDPTAMEFIEPKQVEGCLKAPPTDDDICHGTNLH